MGSKLCALSCATCKGEKISNGRRHGHQHLAQNFRHESYRTCGSGRYGYEESLYNVTAAPIVYMNRIERSTPKRKCKKDYKKPLHSENLSKVEEAVSGIQRDLAGNTLYLPSGLHNTDDMCKKQDNQSIDFNDITLKSDGSSCSKVLQCPEMSSMTNRISKENELSCSKLSSVVESNTVPHTPVEAKKYGGIIFRSHLLQSDSSATTLSVPPNSLNSQFISGITPLGSVWENEDGQNSSTDSVFVEGVGRRQLLQGQYKHYCPSSVIFNNNSLLKVPSAGEAGCSKQNALVNVLSLHVDGSDGPGFDSDFGASAGVEMRIVSSDCSTPRSKTSVVRKWTVAKSIVKPRKYSQDGTLASNEEGQLLTKRSTLENRQQGNNNGIDVIHPCGHHFRSRLATISGAEASNLHATMEWDPYDTAYGSSHWMEYIIPGVTYPSRPLLSDEQYWL